MDDNDNHADLYLNFQDNQEWLSNTFSAMTRSGYRDFLEYVFKELDFAAEAKDGAEFLRVKGLIMGLARRELEIAHFLPCVPDQQRHLAKQAALSYFELAKGFYPADKVAAVEAAWAASLSNAETDGWPTVVAEILPPKRLFRDW